MPLLLSLNILKDFGLCCTGYSPPKKKTMLSATEYATPKYATLAYYFNLKAAEKWIQEKLALFGWEGGGEGIKRYK